MAKYVSRRMRRQRRRRAAPSATTLKRIVKKVKQMDAVDTIFTRFNGYNVGIGSIIAAPSTQQMTGSATGLVSELSAIAESTGSEASRLRNRVQLKKLKLRYNVYQQGSNYLEYNLRLENKVRVMVVLQKHVENEDFNTNAGTYPTLGELLYVQAACLPEDLLAHQNWFNRANFKILYDKIITLDVPWKEVGQTTPLGGGSYSRIEEVTLNLSKIGPTQYTNVGGGIAYANTNRVFLVAFSDCPNANGQPIRMDFNAILLADG